MRRTMAAVTVLASALVGAAPGGCARSELPGAEPPTAPATSGGPGAQRGAEPARVPVLPSASAATSAAGAAASASAAVASPGACPVPPEGMSPVQLVGPLGPASLEFKGEAPRCFPATIAFGRYMNGRYALAADVPRFLETFGSEAGNGDGVTFQMGSEVEILVWGAHNMYLAEPMSEERSRQQYLEDARVVAPGERLITAAREGNAIVRISVLGGKRTVRRSIYEDRLEASAQCTHDEALGAYFEPIAQRLVGSLRTTTGGMYNRPRKANHRYPKD
jgi:hypothetical protein